MSTAAFAAKLNKKLGADLVMSASDIEIPRRYTTGSLALDVAYGGGLPGNQWAEFFGEESSGKTATTFKMLAANQAEDPNFQTFWVAGEHFDRDQAKALGVDLDRVFILKTQAMDSAFEGMLDATESQEFDLIVLDSYPALSTEDEIKKGMDETNRMGGGAGQFNKFCRKAGPVSIRKPGDRAFVGVIINQKRDNPTGFSPVPGGAWTTPGGKGKNYFYYTRLEIKRGKYLTEKRPGITDAFEVGQEIKYRLYKNKSAAPRQSAVVNFYFRSAPSLGFKRGEYDLVKDYTDVGIDMGVVAKSGGFYTFDGQQYHGKDRLTEAIRTDSLMQDKLRQAVLEVVATTEELDTMEG